MNRTDLPRSGRARGFTLMELMMAMVIFTFLGTLVVFMMRQGMNVFTTGTSDSLLQDRTETVLPNVVRDLELLAIPADFDAPPAPPSEEELMRGEVEYVPPPPVDVRVRAGYLTMRDAPEGLKAYPCYYMAWVTDISGVRSDPLIRRAGEGATATQKELVPGEVDKADGETNFQATGGLREVCYVALPEDARYPGLLTLYYGWRSPIGGEGTLLDPKNLSTMAQVRKHCRPIAKGLLHLGALWRRVFAHGWEETTGQVAERGAYVGPVWDSTRALDKTFPLFRKPESLGDPSDDVFPAWVRLEMTLIAPTALGLGRGETVLVRGIGAEAQKIIVESVLPLTGPGSDERWLKLDAEWMSYRPAMVDMATGEVRVRRGLRGTKKAPHDDGAEIYLGLTTESTVRLLSRDHYAREEGARE